MVSHTNRRRREELERLAPVLDHPASLAEVAGREFDVVFYPGGHGPMEDLAYDATSAGILTAQLELGRPVALLCHSPAAVVATADDAGRTPFAGYRMTGLSNREELGTPGGEEARRGCWRTSSLSWGSTTTATRSPSRPHVVRDRNVYSGQNPQSSEDLARLIVADVNSQPE
ncbi:DJ-1/PfpI family protein [Corynebacterium suedekumii]|nr:DJ-1/PfpI family protein [Corynebacterium suedekumii]